MSFRKKIRRCFFTVAAAMLMLPMSSCANPDGHDIYYIHAVSFDGAEHGIVMSVLLESAVEYSTTEQNSSGITGSSGNEAQNNNGGKKPYFIDSFSAKDCEHAANRLFDKYDKCYAGRAQIYLFGENLSRGALFDIAAFIPSSPLLPSQSSAVCTSGAYGRAVLELIASEKELDGLKKLLDGKNVNAVRFFAINADKHSQISIPVLKVSGDDRISIDASAVYKNCAVVTDKFRKAK